VKPARHPYRLTPARQLADAELGRHVADLVRLVLLTEPGERLHHADFGAGLGGAALFEPLDAGSSGLVEMRARGSLERALGDRIEVLAVNVSVERDSAIEAEVQYRLRGSSEATSVGVSAGA